VAQGSPPRVEPVPPAWTAPPRSAGGSAATKIILIVVGALLLLGGIGVGGLVYVGYWAKQKIAELKQQYSVTGETASSSSSSSTSSSTANARVFQPSKGSGCRLLEGQEAAGILEVAVERVEFTASGPDGSESCQYWINAAERQRLERAQIAAGISAVGKSDEKNAVVGAEKAIGGLLSAVIDAAGENRNEDAAFTIQLWRSGGKAAWDKMESSQSQVKGATGVDFGALGTLRVEGVGDRAMILPAGHSIMVLKGDAFFMLGFQQFVPGREKTTALARAVAGRM
jgi:hypothetical protein